MKTGNIIIAGLSVAIGCGLIGVLALRHRSTPQEAVRQPVTIERETVPLVKSNAPTEPPPAEAASSIDRVPQVRQKKPDTTTKIKAPGEVAPGGPDMVTDPVILERAGRNALSFVGADADAEAVWILAINNPSLSAEARQNLIEDLNEDGLSDPKNPSTADLPLIASRMQLIEQLAPFAMDDVNAAAFQEAYKDLVNMWSRLTGQ